MQMKCREFWSVYHTKAASGAKNTFIGKSFGAQIQRGVWYVLVFICIESQIFYDRKCHSFRFDPLIINLVFLHYLNWRLRKRPIAHPPFELVLILSW